MNAVGRVLLLLGAAGTAICAVLPWVTVKGLTFAIDLGVIGASVTPSSVGPGPPLLIASGVAIFAGALALRP